MFKFFEALKTKSSSNKIKAGIGEAEAALSAARESHTELNTLHGPALLEGTDADVDAIEAKIAAKSREIDRLVVGIEALRERLAEAKGAEAAADLDKTLKAAETASQDGVNLIADYTTHAEAIGKILTELDAINRVVGDANKTALTAGDERRIDRPCKIAHANSGGETPGFSELIKTVVLPVAGEIGNFFWSPNQGGEPGIARENRVIALAEKKSA